MQLNIGGFLIRRFSENSPNRQINNLAKVSCYMVHHFRGLAKVAECKYLPESEFEVESFLSWMLSLNFVLTQLEQGRQPHMRTR